MSSSRDEHGGASPTIDELADENARLRAELAAARAAPLRGSDATFRAMFEMATQAIVLLGRDAKGDAVILDANAAMAELHGYGVDALRGRPFADLVAPSDRAAAAAAIGRTFRGERLDAEGAQLHRDGSELLVEVRAAPVTLGDEALAVAFFRDVTEARRLERERERAVDALRASEAHHRAMFELASEAIALLGERDDGSPAILDANGAMAEMHGYTIDELRGMPPSRLLPPEEVAPATEQIGKVLTGERTARESAHVRKDGSRLIVEVRSARVTVDGRPCALGFFRDTTERRRMEEELRASEERHRVLFEEAAEPILAFRVEGEPLGRIVACNAAAAAIGGYTSEELCQKTLFDIVAPDDRANVAARFAVLRENRSSRGETILLRKDGSTFPCVFRSGLARLGGESVALSVGHDVTEQQRAQEELRASEERYRIMFETAAEPVFVFPLEGPSAGRIVAVNAAAGKLTGYTRDELVGMSISQVSPPEAILAIPGRLARVLQEQLVEHQTTLVRKDGAEVPVAFRTGLSRLGGEPVALAFARDVSAQRATEEALLAAKAAAEAANRAKSSFLANMSHEIRTPMNAILGYAQLLARDPRISPAHRKAVDIIARSGEHLLGLVNDVLELSKIEAGHRGASRDVADLHALLDEVGQMFELRAGGKGLLFEISRAPSLPRYAVTDESKLRQMLVNLIGNAVKFTERGGVAVRAAVRPSGDEQRLVIEVEDTGPGIEAAALGRLFQPFAQARVGIEAQGGTGLGLAISREFARLLGGTITVESQADRGTVFRLSLPFEEGQPQGDLPREAAREVVRLSDPARSPRILLAADDEGQRWVGSLLRDVGFTVREVSDGPQAIAAFADWAPELVLMDTMLPLIDGGAAAAAIRRMARGDVPIVLVTATAFDDGPDARDGANADGWLRKPVRTEAVLSEIARHLRVAYHHATKPAPRPPTPPLGIRRAALALRGPELAEGLRRACLVADYAQAHRLVDEISLEDEGLGEELRALLERFDYDAIVTALTA